MRRIAIVIVFLTSILVCDNSDYKPSLRYYREVYLSKLKLSKDSVNAMKVNYVSKAKDLILKYSGKPQGVDNYFYEKLTSEENIQWLEFYRVNINKYEEFKNYGVDLLNLLFDGWIPEESFDIQFFANRYFYSGIILSGTIIDKNIKITELPISKSKNIVMKNYCVEYELEIASFIKGAYLLDSIPNKITLITELLDIDQYTDHGIEIKNKILKNFSEEIKMNENVIVYLPLGSGEDVYENFKDGSIQLHENEYPWVFMGMTNQKTLDNIKIDKNFEISINELIDYYKKLEEINDTSNFYNRSYK